jgi:hypothetical protein
LVRHGRSFVEVLMAGLLDDIRTAEQARARGLLSHTPQPRVTGRQVADAMQSVGLLASPIPVLGDMAGLLGDAAMYAAKPEERTAGNMALTALGALPLVPSVAGKVGKAAHKVKAETLDVIGDELKREFSVWKNADEPMGYASVGVYKGRPMIDMIEVAPKYQRQGIARAIVDEIAKQHGGYGNIDWGYMTDEGEALKKSLDALYRAPAKK